MRMRMKWYKDDLVDRLIAANTARPRPGMDRADPGILERIGQARWSETLKAQERQPVPPDERDRSHS